MNMEELTFEKVVQRLCDGLTYNEDQYNQIKNWLMGYQEANQLTLKQLDDLCFEESEWIFDHVFVVNDRDYEEEVDRGY